MKRSGFKPRTEPLKRSGSGLLKSRLSSKKPAGRTAKWYKAKVYEAFMRSYRGQPCAICGLAEYTCAHHVICKGSCPHHIVTPEMVIVLCRTHHLWAHGGRPHTLNPFVVCSFMEWLEANLPEQYDWCKTHQHDTALTHGKIDWKAKWEALSK